jgi:hypothetical protein
MTVDEILATFATIHDRAALVAFLTPLRLSNDLSDFDRERVTRALVAAASRCWRGRVSG